MGAAYDGAYAVLQTCLLTELGFSTEEIKKLFSRNKRYQRESIFVPSTLCPTPALSDFRYAWKIS